MNNGTDRSREQNAADRATPVEDARCVSCASPSAQRHDTSDGRVWMCPACAVMNGLGCP